MLLTEYLEEHDLYLVIPVHNGKPDKENEFLFDNEDDQEEFIYFYFINPFAAIFAYHTRVNGMQHRLEAQNG